MCIKTNLWLITFNFSNLLSVSMNILILRKHSTDFWRSTCSKIVRKLHVSFCSSKRPFSYAIKSFHFFLRALGTGFSCLIPHNCGSTILFSLYVEKEMSVLCVWQVGSFLLVGLFIYSHALSRVMLLNFSFPNLMTSWARIPVYFPSLLYAVSNRFSNCT